MQPNIALTPALTHALFQQNPDAVLVLDEWGNVLLANAAAGWLSSDGGYPHFVQLTGIPWPAELEMRPDGKRHWSRRLRIQGGDGEVRQVEASLFSITLAEQQAQPLFCCMLKDVTAIVQAARATQDHESRSKVTTDMAPVLIRMAGADGMCDWFNKSWLGFRGRTLGDELGEGWIDGVHPEDLERCLAIYSYCVEVREPFSMDYRLRRHDGVFRWVLDTGIPRFGRDGEFLGYIATALDITDRKELEDRLAERTRQLRLADRRREAFLAKLSHELRNPLAPIANAAAILRNLERGDPHLVTVREIIERQVAQLRRLITDLVDVTRVTQGQVVLQRERLDVDALIDSAIDEVLPETERRRQVLRVQRSIEPLACAGDAQRLSQALAALLGNAAKFSPDASAIVVAVRRREGMLEVSVRDLGRGIAPEFVPHAFELFAQADESLGHADGGLGVGLTIAKQIARLHDGDVQIESAGHRLGTTATLSLPLLAGADDAEKPVDDCDLARVAGRRVLIVEDNADARESLRMLVELGGNDVRTAANAAEGLRVVEHFAPELVVCDIGLPDVDGFELVQRLRDKLADQATRFIALTGYGRVEDRERALDSGFDSFYIKPLQPAR
ncbi:MAG TPA: ATP-binding protein [Burkholderiaceae bacterium]|nr:ATP-binding protein [Burkholderiaceae bacterium]